MSSSFPCKSITVILIYVIITHHNRSLSHSGEKKRVGLSAALLKQPDVLLLDEPTNHLDIDALEWLADFLKPGGKDKDMAMLLVTHDRFFLEKVCSESKFHLVNITVLLQCNRTVQILWDNLSSTEVRKGLTAPYRRLQNFMVFF
jgi:ABC-type multidrug transport system ATPase subunit